mgnify:CR=1 FL=1
MCDAQKPLPAALPNLGKLTLRSSNAESLSAMYDDLPNEIKQMILKNAAILTIRIIPRVYYRGEKAFPERRIEIPMVHHPNPKVECNVEIGKLFLRDFFRMSTYRDEFEHSPICTDAALKLLSDKKCLVAKPIETYRFFSIKPPWRNKDVGNDYITVWRNAMEPYPIEVSGDASARTLFTYDSYDPSAFARGDKIEIRVRGTEQNDKLDKLYPTLHLPENEEAILGVERLRYAGNRELIFDQREFIVAVHVKSRLYSIDV